MGEDLRGFSSYSLLLDSRVAHNPLLHERNQATEDALAYMMRTLENGGLREFVFNRVEQESYSDQWNAEHIRSVELDHTTEIGETYQHYHIHARIVIRHQGLRDFGLDYGKFRQWVYDTMEEYVGGFYSESFPRAFVRLKLNRTDDTELLKRYLEKPSNNVELSSNRIAYDGPTPAPDNDPSSFSVPIPIYRRRGPRPGPRRRPKTEPEPSSKVERR